MPQPQLQGEGGAQYHPGRYGPAPIGVRDSPRPDELLAQRQPLFLIRRADRQPVYLFREPRCSGSARPCLTAESRVEGQQSGRCQNRMVTKSVTGGKRIAAAGVVNPNNVLYVNELHKRGPVAQVDRAAVS